jgi:hypothetical protein
VKYLLMIYTNAATWGHPTYLRTPEVQAMSAADRDELTRQLDELSKEIRESGEWIGGEALADPAASRTVRVRDGAPATTDGPFIEAKEQLAGYFIVDCESIERASEIAAGIPDARFAAIEVRPIMDYSGQEM